MRHGLDALAAKFPKAAAHLDAAQYDVLAFTAFPREIWSGDPPTHRRGRHLPRPHRPDPPRRRGPGRAERRMDRNPTLHGTRPPRLGAVKNQRVGLVSVVRVAP